MLNPFRKSAPMPEQDPFKPKPINVSRKACWENDKIKVEWVVGSSHVEIKLKVNDGVQTIPSVRLHVDVVNQLCQALEVAKIEASVEPVTDTDFNGIFAR